MPDKSHANIFHSILLLSAAAYSFAADVSPALVNTTALPVYFDASFTRTVREPASPALLTGVTRNGGFEVWLADGRYAWLKSLPAAVPAKPA